MSNFPSQEVAYLRLDALKPYDRNARTHPKRQIKMIADSIERFGFTNPILVDDRMRILAGHGRVAAARLLGWLEVPTLRLKDMSEAEKRAYVLADNRLAEKAGWDREVLAGELQALIDLDFEVELTGFETTEIDLIIEEGAKSEAAPKNPDDKIPAIAKHAVSRVGDLWRLGDHRILCGDSRDSASYDRLMEAERARLIVTDPPYNVRIHGHVSGGGAIRHREFAMAAGELSGSEFEEFLRSVFNQLVRISTNGSLHFVFMDWRHQVEILAAGARAYSELKNLCVWNKSNGGMGSLYRSKHELVFLWKAGDGDHVNNVELGRHGRNRSNVWDYAGVNTFRTDRLDELTSHPTPKPVAMIADAIRDCSHRNDIVLDPFCGSGTILIAAERTGRRARTIELDPIYVDVAVRRWQKFTGLDGVHAESGETFDEASQRAKGRAAAQGAEVSRHD